MYAANDPLNLVDLEGQGVLDLVKCIYYQRRLSEAQRQCTKECSDDLLGAMDKYDALYGDAAMIKCACSKVGADICAKAIASCAKAGVPGPRIPER